MSANKICKGCNYGTWPWQTALGTMDDFCSTACERGARIAALEADLARVTRERDEALKKLHDYIDEIT